MMRQIGAVDIGGTKIAAGIVRDDGKVFLLAGVLLSA
jgi:predicted NBD/HSP70 family sugar kinase